MTLSPLKKSLLGLLSILIPLLLLFSYTAFNSGPLMPIHITLLTVESKAISPSLYGIGAVGAQYRYKIGPIFTGRVTQINVQVGDSVKKGQVLGEMDIIDLDEQISAKIAAIKVAKSQLQEAQIRYDYAQTQAVRYTDLFMVKSTSEEIVTTKKQDLLISKVRLNIAQENIEKMKAEKKAIDVQLNNLLLIAPFDGLVVKRDVDPGSTVIAGQAVIEIIDPNSLWINVRFNQIQSTGLAANLPAHIKLKSRSQDILKGHVLRIDPLADVVTEEILAKVIFEKIPVPLPPIGELSEVVVYLPKLSPKPVVPNVAIKQKDGVLGIWKYTNNKLYFMPIITGAANIDGDIQINAGIKTGDKIVVYSEKTLKTHSRVSIVKTLQEGLK